MVYEVVLRLINTESVQKFDRDQNALMRMEEEWPVELCKVRLDGYHPKLKKELFDFLAAKFE
jgi:hypothetical protein